ncbi:hypothetical protein IGJ18_001533 [Enterococcus sp. AZ078]
MSSQNYRIDVFSKKLSTLEVETKVLTIKYQKNTENCQETQTLVFSVDCYLLGASQIFD